MVLTPVLITKEIEKIQVVVAPIPLPGQARHDDKRFIAQVGSVQVSIFLVGTKILLQVMAPAAVVFR